MNGNRGGEDLSSLSGLCWSLALSCLDFFGKSWGNQWKAVMKKPSGEKGRIYLWNLWGWHYRCFFFPLKNWCCYRSFATDIPNMTAQSKMSQMWVDEKQEGRPRLSQVTRSWLGLSFVLISKDKKSILYFVYSLPWKCPSQLLQTGALTELGLLVNLKSGALSWPTGRGKHGQQEMQGQRWRISSQPETGLHTCAGSPLISSDLRSILEATCSWVVQWEVLMGNPARKRERFHTYPSPPVAAQIVWAGWAPLLSATAIST